MPDVFANITQASPAMVEGIAATLELRASLPYYQDILKTYLAEVAFPAEVEGCLRAFFEHMATFMINSD